MSPIFITTLVFAAVTIFTRVLSFFFKKRKDTRRNLFLRLSKEGSANNLVFCSQELLPNKVMGIDGIHRKIMILEKDDHTYKSSIISLDDMQACELKQSYGALMKDNLTGLELEKALNKIELQFASKNSERPASITFYDHLINSKREIVLMKAKAEYWSKMLSKMVARQAEEARA